MKLSPQQRAVLDHIKKNGSISPFEAIMDHGITRLAARIGELKALGYDIPVEMKKNQATKKRYARYSLKDVSQ